MKNIKTPIISPLRGKGGTFYTFYSALEDVGININEQQNSVKLSHYALLNIPECDESNNDNYNKFNVLTSLGGMVDHNTNINPNDRIADSFMSYALNFETTILNDANYDFTTSLNTSERVFWKWLKETGAIRWHKKIIDSSTSILVEGDADSNTTYNRVVQAIGKIDANSQRSGTNGIYNEVYVNIPSSLGTYEPISFNEIEDANYSYDRIYSNNNEYLNGIDRLDVNAVKYKSYYDYANNSDIDDVINYYTVDGDNTHWGAEYVNNTTGDPQYYYIINKKPNDANENNLIHISNDKIQNVDYSIIRSNYDCITLNFDVPEGETFDSMCLKDESTDYHFNTILIYYSIYDRYNNKLATNLFGVYFIDSPEQLKIADSDNMDETDTLHFNLPALRKIKSDNLGFGTSYAFKINLRTQSIYDDSHAPIIDYSASENSLVSDFSDVIFNLNKSIDLLSKYTKYTSSIQRDYKNIIDKINIIETQLTVAQQNINNIKNNKNSELIDYNSISTHLLNIKSEIKMLNDNIIITDSDSNEIIKIDNIVDFNKDIKTDNYLISTVRDSSIIEKTILDKFNDEFNKIQITVNPTNQNLLSINIDTVDTDIKDSNIKYLTKNGELDLTTLLAIIINKLQNK